LTKAGLRRQLERYRRAGRGATLVERTARGFTVDLNRRVAAGLVEDMIATERECCPFFDLRWEPEERRLKISVSRPEHQPALDAIAFALALRAPAQCARSD
jgi:hypothetical protein